jgi:hypothetical protein
MKRPRLFVAIQIVAVLLAFASLAFAGSNAADLGNWITYYYMHPQPDDIPARVREMAALGAFRKQSDDAPMVAFLAEVFRQNPNRIAGWFESLQNTSGDVRSAIILAAWESKTKEGTSVLNALGAQKEQDFALQIRKQKPIDLAKDQIDSPAFLDMLWATFFASGNAWPVVRIIGVLSWKEPAEGVANRTGVILIIGAARWSLSSNAFQHRRVYEICQYTKPKLNPAGRQALSEILQKVDDRNVRGQASAPSTIPKESHF